MAAASVTADDRFLALEDLVPSWDRFDPDVWKEEVERYLEDRDNGLEEEADFGPLFTEAERLEMVVPLHKARSPRARRRRLQRLRLRGVRPKDPVEAKQTHWYKRSKKADSRQPQYTRLRIVFVHNDDGELEEKVKRFCPKRTPKRCEMSPPIELEPDDQAVKEPPLVIGYRRCAAKYMKQRRREAEREDLQSLSAA